MRSALRGLDSRNAETVGRHLVAAGGLLDENPELALQHARAARDRASRIAAVREAVGVAAYHASDFAEAARELRAYRRMTGDESYRAVLADCERALGRPDNALRLVNEALTANPEPDEIVELRLVEAGARHDMGELPAALLVLEAALGGRPSPRDLNGVDLGRLRVATAYADLLEEQGEGERAAEWFGAIAAADPDDLTGVSTRFGDDEDDESPDPAAADDDGRPTDEHTQAQVEREASAEEGPEAPSEGVVADSDSNDMATSGHGDDVDPHDIEAEVAELLGEAPPPRAALEFDHRRLFQEAPEQEAPEQAAPEGSDPGEHRPPTN